MKPTDSFRFSDVLASNLLGYLIAIALVASLVMSAGVWNILANTRLLDVLIEAGFIQYHDKQLGFIAGIPEVEYYLMAKDPVDWYLMGAVVVLLLLFWLIKLAQFHDLSKFFGTNHPFVSHSRAYLHGQGLNQAFPYHTGDLATAMALNPPGQDPSPSLYSLFTMRLLAVFEIALFAIIALLTVGWGTWLVQMFWGAVILALAFWFAHHSQPNGLNPWPLSRHLVQQLSQQPRLLMKLLVLSSVAFFLEHVAAYVTVMAFTSEHVILNIDFSLLLTAVVAGYLARLVPITPGGIGQFEWGFAAALYFGGLGLPEAATIALIYGFTRYLVTGLLAVAVHNQRDAQVALGDVLIGMGRKG